MKNDSGIDLEKLAAHLRTKRGDRGLRAIAEAIEGVSASTLSRIEQGAVPDLPTFIRICAWLGTSPEEFVDAGCGLKRKTSTGSDLPVPEAIEAQLRRDKVLTNTTVDAISEMVRVAYRAAGADRGKSK
jgi:transcriptional regulator with XRE-family HTH domain